VEKTETDKLLEAQGELGTDYARKLRAALHGMGSVKEITNAARLVAIIATDAATEGRMGVIFYQALWENEYKDRILAWHESCCWSFRFKGKSYISAPSVKEIIEVVFGESKGKRSDGEDDKGYVIIQKQARERILRNIICGEPLSRSWVSAAVKRVSSPFSYGKADGGWDKPKWEYKLNVACAVVRKYYYEKKEEFQLNLDNGCTDRDYLFGRLLAIADRLESYARYLQTGGDAKAKKGTIKSTTQDTNDDKDKDKRPTNAVRYMSAFAAKPLRTWLLIFNNLNPYIQRLNSAEWYQRQIDGVMSLFSADGFDDKPLGGKYLLGYSLQRKELYDKNGINKNEEEMNDELNKKD
jgi:CRISPR-associated protein Csd1